MPWTATTDHDALAAGATLRIALGPSDVPPQPGQEIALSRGGGGAETILTVVSAAADRLEVTDGRPKPRAEAPCRDQADDPRRGRRIPRRLDRGVTAQARRPAGVRAWGSASAGPTAS